MSAPEAQSLRAWLILSAAEGIGPSRGRQLLAAFGLPERVLDAGREALAQRVGPRAAASLLSGAHDALVDRTLAWLEHPAHHVLTLADAAYPPALLTIPDPPLLLYVIGDPAACATPGVAIVGSRNATAQGLTNARNFARALAQRDLAIVSGMALGIDGAAHEGALASTQGTTVAVLGTGVDVVYPSRHRALYDRIAARGAIVSEQPLGMPALAHQFPQRNRLICGLSRAVLVVEAAMHSGSLITARVAAEQGRDVFAIPGSIHSPLSKGCHRLIKDGAKLVDDIADILGELPPVSAAASPTVADTQADAAVPPWLRALGHDPFSIDDVIDATGLDAAQVSARLLDLELDGHLAPMPGGRWQRT